MRKEVDLSVIVPCLNEAENIRPVLENILRVLAVMPNRESEIVVVDEQSKDDTYNKAKEFIQYGNLEDKIFLIRRDLHRKGYGAVVR
jgi:dolichol-phosphate mannosyltransferase